MGPTQQQRRRRLPHVMAAALVRGASYLLSGCLLVALYTSGRLHGQHSARHQQLSLLQHLYHGPGPPPPPPAYEPLSSAAAPPRLRGGAIPEAAAAAEEEDEEGPRRRRRYLAFVPLKGLKPDSPGGRRDDDQGGDDEQEQEQEDEGEEEEEQEEEEGTDRPFRDRSTPAAVWAGGPSRASLEVERLTLRAWNALAEYGRRQTPPVKVTVLGMVEDAAHCDTALLGELAHVACLPLEAACRHPEYGIMTVDCILRAAWAQGHAHVDGDEGAPDAYILANGDVVFTPTLFDAIGLAYRTFVDGEPPPTLPPAPPPQQKEEGEQEESDGDKEKPVPAPVFIPPGTRGFALVGRRLDLNVTLPSDPDDPPLTEASLLAPGVAVRVHQATGIDYFAFTPDAFPHDFPPFLIGRWRWDNALLLHFLLAPGVATVDGSEVVHALHLGMAESSGSKQHQARAGGRYNDELASGATGRAHALGRIDATAYVLKAAAGRNRTEAEEEAAGEQEAGAPRRPGLVLAERGRTMSAAQLAALRLAGGRGAGLVNAGVTVVPVPYGEVAAALEWACWARARAGVGNFVLLAADREEAEALAVAIGGSGDGGAVVHLHPKAVSIKGGAGGNMQYYRDKKTGRASPAALALGTAHAVQRLLRLNLTVAVADVRLKWNRDPSSLLLAAPEGPDEASCDLAVLDLDESSSAPIGPPLYLLRPSREAARQWRRVLACIEDTIRHPKRYGPGFSCVRARLVEGVVGMEEDKDEGGEGGDGDEDEEEPKPWRACRVDGRAPRSWFPTRALLRRQQAFVGMSEPWGVLDDDEEGTARSGGGQLWDAAAGECVGTLDGWLLAAIQPPRAQDARE